MNWMQRERRRGRDIDRPQHRKTLDPIDWSKVLLQILAVLMISLVMLSIVEKFDNKLQKQTLRREK